MAEAQPAQEDLRRLLGSLSEGAAVSNESIEAAALRAAAAVLKAESGGEDKAESDSEEESDGTVASEQCCQPRGTSSSAPIGGRLLAKEVQRLEATRRRNDDLQRWSQGIQAELLSVQRSAATGSEDKTKRSQEISSISCPWEQKLGSPHQMLSGQKDVSSSTLTLRTSE